MFDDLVDGIFHHVDRDGEADADIAAAAAQDRRIDADQLALRVDQGAAGIAGIDGGVGLDEVLVAFDAESGPAQRDRQSVLWGKSVSVRVSSGGRLILKKKNKN